MVVANPPYMGSSSLGKWMGSWVKKHYPEAYRDLCTGFIDLGFGMSADDGYSAMVTMQSWMFLGSFEKLRGKILRNHSVSSMAHLGTRAFGAIGGEVVSTTATVFANAKNEVRGAYFRLVDMSSEEEKQAGLLEALANPDCGWFYRADATEFKVIPGTPIAYWASKSLYRSFSLGTALREYVEMPYGFKTGDNDRFLRMWWECSMAKLNRNAVSADCAAESLAKWFPYNKGGSYRKWYGNNEYVLNYENNGNEVIGMAIEERRNASDYSRDLLFKPVVTWSRISSGRLHMRYSCGGAICDMTGSGYYGPPQTLEYLQAFCNSSIAMQIAEVLSPTLDYQPGQIGSYPIIIGKQSDVELLTNENISTAKQDWDYFESSWDFMKHPLI